MKNVLLHYLKENINDEVSAAQWTGQDNLPLFLSEKYDYHSVELLGASCLFLEILVDTSSIASMQKDINLISKQTEKHLVFFFKTISQFKRKNLIKHHIPFVVENGQMYLPFLGLDLSNLTKKTKEPISHFSSMTQFVYLYWLYHADWVTNATDLAKHLGVTKMHMSRTLNDLYNIDLLTFEWGGGTGRSKNYRRIPNPDYFRLGKKFLKDPIRKIVYLKTAERKYKYAGLDALSRASMLNPPKHAIQAISKIEARRIENRFITDLDVIKNENLLEIQIWQYDPVLLTETDQVDILSLALSLKPYQDERIEQAVENNLKGESWYTD